LRQSRVGSNGGAGAGAEEVGIGKQRHDDLFRHFFASECCLKGELQIALRLGRKGIGNAVQ
jgi:hypothetical protein